MPETTAMAIMANLRQPEFYNTKVKVYPDGVRRVTVCSHAIFKEDGWELTEIKDLRESADFLEEIKRDRVLAEIYELQKDRDLIEEPFGPSVFGNWGRLPSEILADLKAELKKEAKPKNMTNDVRSDNLKRAKERVFDIAYCNEFTHFVTWTLNKEMIDRYDAKEVSKKLHDFLHNMQKRHNLLYLVIPELHKDGAIHMHGLISGEIDLVDSGKKTSDGKAIYNMPQWKLGFSTAIELSGDRINVAKYITKYITKDFKKIFGSFYYAGGHGLQRKPSIELCDMDYEKVKEKAFLVPAANREFKYFVVEV